MSLQVIRCEPAGERYGEAMDITTPVGLDSPWMVTETGVPSPVVAVSGIRTWIRKTPVKPKAKPAETTSAALPPTMTDTSSIRCAPTTGAV